MQAIEKEDKTKPKVKPVIYREFKKDKIKLKSKNYGTNWQPEYDVYEYFDKVKDNRYRYLYTGSTGWHEVN